MSINIKLLKGAKNVHEKEEIKSLFKRNHRLLNMLVDALEEDLRHSQQEFKREANYDRPNWELYIVDKLAEQRTIENLIDLIKSSYNRT